MNAYAMLGYDTSELIAQATARVRGMIVRRLFIQQFIDYFAGQIDEVRTSKRFRPLLRVRKTGQLISIIVARFLPTARTREPRWFIELPKSERKRVAILGLMDERNSAITTMWVFRNMKYPNLTTLKFSLDGEWLQTGERLQNVGDFLDVLSRTRFPTSGTG
jgi:hypothetical protein